MTILLYKIKSFSKCSFSCPLCIIEHVFESTQESDEKSYIGFYIKKWRLYKIKLYKIEHFPKFSLFLPLCMIEHDIVSIPENDEKS